MRKNTDTQAAEEHDGPVRTLILGAGGRDFHNFNMLYRNDPNTQIVGFTAAQIPDIDNRHYPAELAGPLYPDGIPIYPESDLEELCTAHEIGRVLLAYSDLSHRAVMTLAARAQACGADFMLAGPGQTMLRANRPVIAVSAIRTGCGKSQTARFIFNELRARGLNPAVLRHPMPYGDLARQKLQRFANLDDLAAADCTHEEREEYEPYIAAGGVVFAGVDYAAILEAAEREADILLWDGGNNDFPFLVPDFHIVLADALRPGQAASYYPGEANLRMADLVLVNKADAAGDAQTRAVIAEIRALNPDVPIRRTGSPVTLEHAALAAGKRVIVVEDGPTLTHGGMATGAGFAAAKSAGVAEIIDPRQSATPEIAALFAQYPHIGPVLPAVGYNPAQRAALAATIARSDAALVIIGTPFDLARIIPFDKPALRARYELSDMDSPGLAAALDDRLRELGLS